MMGRFFLYPAVALILLLVHFLIVPYLALAHIVPDVILVFLTYLAIREGRLTATVAGFILGFLLDLSGGEASVLGLSALAKSVSGFVAGLFYSEVRMFQTLGSYRFAVVVAIASFAHNIIYFLIYLQGTDISFGDTIFLYAVPGTLYCILVSLLPMFFFSRKYAG